MTYENKLAVFRAGMAVVGLSILVRSVSNYRGHANHHEQSRAATVMNLSNIGSMAILTLHLHG